MASKLHRIDTSRLSYSRDLTYQYHKFNEKYFGGRLCNLEVYWEPMPPIVKKDKTFTHSGYTAIKRGTARFIAINKKLNQFCDLAHVVLLHEMIHVKYPSGAENHGRVFQRERRRLVKAGAVTEII